MAIPFECEQKMAYINTKALLYTFNY